MARGEFEIMAAVGFGPKKHGFPESGADALAADGLVGDKIFEIGVFAEAWAHDNR